MISFFKNLKANKLNRGMSYTELIVVLGIFAVMTSIVLFDYNTFQDKVDIKNLAVDIASKLVEAQKSAMGGKFTTSPFCGTCKPSYGLYFSRPNNDKIFLYFSDLNNTLGCDTSGSDCSVADDVDVDGEILDVIKIGKGNFISKTEVSQGGVLIEKNPMNIYFKRPNPATIARQSVVMGYLTDYDYIQITVSSPGGAEAVTACIQVYPSGRIQIKCTTP